jgi:hypothetical protein
MELVLPPKHVLKIFSTITLLWKMFEDLAVFSLRGIKDD